jgi:hypothetical protein
MTVGKLREKLEGVPDDQEVILSSDPEGNRYWGAEGAYVDQLWMEDHLVHPEDFEDLSREKVKLVTYIAPKHTTP